MLVSHHTWHGVVGWHFSWGFIETMSSTTTISTHSHRKLIICNNLLFLNYIIIRMHWTWFYIIQTHRLHMLILQLPARVSRHTLDGDVGSRRLATGGTHSLTLNVCIELSQISSSIVAEALQEMPPRKNWSQSLLFISLTIKNVDKINHILNKAKKE